MYDDPQNLFVHLKDLINEKDRAAKEFHMANYENLKEFHITNYENLKEFHMANYKNLEDRISDLKEKVEEHKSHMKNHYLTKSYFWWTIAVVEGTIIMSIAGIFQYFLFAKL